MRPLIVLMCCLLSLGEGGLSSLGEGPRPRFSDYRVKHIYQGTPARPIITKEWRSFRTAIRRGADSDVQFAGHYTLPGWGCGTSCSVFVVVDSISGKVYDGLGVHGLPIEWVEGHEGGASELMEFQRNSRLLRINACLGEGWDCGFFDYLMVEGKGLKLLRKECLPKGFQMLPPDGIEVQYCK